MSKRKVGQERGKYTLEFKREAVRQVKGWQAAPEVTWPQLLLLDEPQPWGPRRP